MAPPTASVFRSYSAVSYTHLDVYKRQVDDDAAKIVQLIFYKYVHEGYGAQRLCRYLTELGIRKACLLYTSKLLNMVL